MDQLRKISRHTHFKSVFLFAVVAVVVLIVVVSALMSGTDPYNAKASRKTFLTPGDDALSLQQDLDRLGEDTTVTDEDALNFFRE